MQARKQTKEEAYSWALERKDLIEESLEDKKEDLRILEKSTE